MRTNLIEEDPAKLWSHYLLLVAVEEAFKNLKGRASKWSANTQRMTEQNTAIPIGLDSLWRRGPHRDPRLNEIVFP